MASSGYFLPSEISVLVNNDIENILSCLHLNVPSAKNKTGVLELFWGQFALPLMS